MKNKNVIIPVLAVLVIVLLLVSGYLLWSSRTKTEKEVVNTGLPARFEEYYREASPSPDYVVEVENVADIDSMAKEIDSEKIDIDSGIAELDRDFSSF